MLISPFGPFLMAPSAGGLSPILAYGPAVTLNSSDKSGDITLDVTNLIAENTNTDSNWDCVRATVGRSAGAYYWESKLTAVNNSNYICTGVGDASMSLTVILGGTANSAGYRQGSFQVTGSGIAENGGTTAGFALNDVVRHMLDMDRGEYYIGLNSTWIGSGSDPVTRTNPAITGLVGTFFPAVSIRGSSGGSPSLNKWTLNFGGSAFAYSIPS